MINFFNEHDAAIHTYGTLQPVTCRHHPYQCTTDPLEVQGAWSHLKELWPIPVFGVSAVGTQPHCPKLSRLRKGPGGVGT